MTNKLPKLLALATFSVALFTILSTSSASAATINVTLTDNPTPTNDADCTLREAIENINTQTNAVNTDCAAGDGLTDTIIIPSGNIILEADLPTITASMTIQGQGMGSTIVSGNAGQYSVFTAQFISTEVLRLEGMKITAFVQAGLYGIGGSYELHHLDLDGTGTDPLNTVTALGMINGTAPSNYSRVSDIYIHDFAMNTQTFQPLTISNSGTDDSTAQVDNVTIAHMTNTGQINALSLTTNTIGSGGVGDITGSFNNITINDLVSSGGIVSGLGVISFGIANVATLSVHNATLGYMQGVDAFLPGYGAIGLFAAGAGLDTQQQPQANLIVSNTITFDSDGCVSVDISGPVTAPGTSITSITSQGGNLSDDASCAPYFTQPTDQNNVAALAASLLPLADNGGDVPTMALKEGSPAVDSGITVSGLTTDARQAARPQGSAYDSGAYESPYTKPAAELAKSGQGATAAAILASTVILASLLFFTRKRLYAHA